MGVAGRIPLGAPRVGLLTLTAPGPAGSMIALTHPPMRPALPVALLALALSHSPIQADQASLDRLVQREQARVDNEAFTVYGGNVGRLEAVFFIEWSGDGNLIDGSYYYPARNPEVRYKLKGSNPQDGVLLLNEFTPKGGGSYKLTAKCRLTKQVTGSRIVWKGQMSNTDGRKFPMRFSRPR